MFEQVQSTNNIAFSVCLKIDQLEVSLDKVKENIETKEHQIYKQVMKLGKEGMNIRAPQKSKIMFSFFSSYNFLMLNSLENKIKCNYI